MNLSQAKHLKARRGITPTQKLVLYEICQFANASNEAWPGYDTIAEISGLAERTVYLAVKALEEAGFLVRFDTSTGRGNRVGWRLNYGPEEDIKGAPDAAFESERVQMTAGETAERVQMAAVPIRRNNNSKELNNDREQAYRGSEVVSADAPKSGANSSVIFSENAERSGAPTSEPDRRAMFDLDRRDDPRFSTAHAQALFEACRIDVRLARPRDLAKIAGLALDLEDAGYSAEQIGLAASRWPYPTAPEPAHFARRIRALLEQKTEVKPNGTSVTEVRSGGESEFARKFRERNELCAQLGSRFGGGG